MHRSIIAAAAFALFLPSIAAACSPAFPLSHTRIIEDDTPPCFTITGVQDRDNPVLEAINDCAEPITLSCDTDYCVDIVGQSPSGPVEILPGTSAELSVPHVAGEALIEWSDGVQGGGIVYVMEYDGPLPNGCGSPLGCAAAIGAPAPSGAGWMALGLMALLGLCRTRVVAGAVVGEEQQDDIPSGRRGHRGAGL